MSLSIMTGGSSGIGKDLARILYSRNAKIYVVSRTASRAMNAISEIKSRVPESKGDLVYIKVDFEDLASVKECARNFLNMEERLDGLWNNAGVMLPEPGSKTKQGYDLQLGTNTIGPFLFTKLLAPILVSTVQKQKPGDDVRVLWVSSSAAEMISPKGGIDLDNIDYSKRDASNAERYGTSKAGLVLLNQEFARRYREDGIISVSMNPGNLKTDLRRHLPWLLATIFGWMSYDPVYGAYTELFAGFSPDITLDNTGCWVIPWGRISQIRKDIDDSAIPESEGGSGLATKFWNWCEAEVKIYLDD
ncbi:hypothetical protein B7463_g4236, partial [Scytalidium lignicola]